MTDSNGPRINFARIAQAALAAARSLVPTWLPGGRLEGDEYKPLNPLRSDQRIGSFSVNLATGKWGDFAANISGGDLVSLYAYLRYDDDQGKAARALAEELRVDSGTPQPAPAKAKPKSEWVPILPVPDGTPEPRGMAHPHYGEPQGVWAYRDSTGRLLGYIRRYKTSDGSKTILPLTWCRNAAGVTKWHTLAFPVPRPLYWPQPLPGDPDRPVLIVEGEKCADAAHRLLGETFDVVTWPGGAKAIKKIDWAPLAGRLVLIWPDADALQNAAGILLPVSEQPGTAAAEQIAGVLLELGAKVRIVQIPAPGAVAAGWDVADAVTEGWDTARLLEFLRHQREPVGSGKKPRIPAPPATGARAGEEMPAWRERLLWTRGEPKDCRENIIYVLRGHPAWAGVIGADTFAKRIVIRAPSPLGHVVGDEWTANDDIALGLWLSEQIGLLVRSPDTLSAGVHFVARAAPFHPVLEFLQGLTWDEQTRVDSWATQCLGAVDTPYHRKVARYFLINMVRRIFEPGCIMRSVPVLEGGQDKGKSRALRALAGDWFSDTTFRVGDKDAFQQIQGVWLYEISELESFTRAEATAVKAFVSSVEDNFRAPYERQNERHKRQTVFAASTNAIEYLRDWTGNTRFWPLACDRIDLELIARMREQLLAEAVALYRLGERAHPTAEEQAALFGPEQERRMMPHPWRDLIDVYVNPPGGRKDEVTINELLLDCIGYKADKLNPQGSEAQRVGQIMHALGWLKVRAGGKSRTWVWRRPETAATDEDTDSDIPF